ncbi:MAG: NADH-quinone oxidoreductase subunit C [Synergistetes bacterium]|nr:NADH-quinone oxidoreductase subunit C [Synergistota bacterium]MCX8127729.1 NADH-quinone oxidoreductase subunit C [Synergistota bacterium]MDW8191356.1 NADH-quinone oxidoreductase subunit C [Synergistota bacterium]
MKILEAKEIISLVKERLGEDFINGEIKTWNAGVKKLENKEIWLEIKPFALPRFVSILKELDEYPHSMVASAEDIGEDIQVIYHFAIYGGEFSRELQINVKVKVPKSDPRLPSISHLIPGALITEQEKEEMIGVVYENLPERKHVFLADDFPEGIYPWRKDEKGPQSLIRKVNE